MGIFDAQSDPTESVGQQAIPRSLNLSAQKPASIPAYTRRVESIATNAQQFSEWQLANIMLDTSTPGSFLDPTQSILHFDLTITNTNPYVDYVNFSACGAASLIQEMRIICQGTPVEEILDYNTMFEMWMDIGGYSQDEFKLYMDNSWRAPAIHPSTELNFIKPPMVDREGVIMCPNDINMFASPASFAKEQGQYLDQYGGACNYNSDQFHNYLHTIDKDASYNMQSIAPGNFKTKTWIKFLDDTYVTWPSTIRPQKKNLNVEQKLNDLGLKRYRLQDYLQFLSNVKNIPVGIVGSKSMIGKTVGTTGVPDNTQWNFNAANPYSSTTNPNGTITFTVYLPIFSGILGLWAEKAFPTMLIAPGSFYIQVRFARATQAFQLAMDPCRRVIGTYRDYVPNYGLLSGFNTDFLGGHLDSKWNFTRTSEYTQAITSAGANGTDFAYSATLPSPELFHFHTLDGVTNDNEVILFGDIHVPFIDHTGSDTIVSSTAGEYVLAWGPNNFKQILSATQTRGALNNIVLTTLTLSENVTIPPDSNLAAYKYNGARPDWDGGVAHGVVVNHGRPRPFENNYTDDSFPALQGSTTGVPKPQYVPMKEPWKFGQGWSAVTTPGTVFTGYTEEKNICFGTYLSASTSQVRRTNHKAKLNIPAGTAGAPMNDNSFLSYTIANLSYIGQQIILPDEVTASVVRMAVNGDISLTAHSCRTYRAICQQSQNQSIILPIKIASATALFVLFRNTTMEENFNYLSNTRSCPFTSFKMNMDSNFVGSDIAPTIKTVNTLMPFTIQLRLGNELLPITPINSVNFLVKELERAIHATSDMHASIPTNCTIRNCRTIGVTTTTNNVTNAEFISLVDNDFLTPYIPVEALDDQTITDNPAFRDYGNAIANPITDLIVANDRGLYCLNHFIPPVSKFMLGFDLETFPNMSDTIRSGRYLGNGPVTLQLTSTVACNNSSLSTVNNPDTYNIIAVVLHDIRFSIMAGGQVLAYY